MKISEMQYNRPDIEALAARLKKMTGEFISAQRPSKQQRLYEESVGYSKRTSSMATLANIRYTQNTEDEFYLKERAYYDEMSPVIQESFTSFNNAMLDHALPQFRKTLPPIIWKQFETSRKTISPAIIADMQRENELITEYSQLISGAVMKFKGEMLPLTKVKKYMTDPDRKTRKLAYDTIGGFADKNSGALDRIFTELVDVRNKMAQKLGYEDFVELGYYRMSRICFDQNDVETFRKNIIEDIVPILNKLKAQAKKDLRVRGKLKIYDNENYFYGSDPEPFGTVEEIFENGKNMYHDMSKICGEFIDVMLKNEAFDVLSRPNKWSGGYCTYIADYKQPFILANFNGSSADIDVLTHEAGHALAAYCAKDLEHYYLENGGMETCEIHSMSMEFFAWKYMQKFFKAPGDYMYKHLADSLTFLPYGTMVDHFQHIMYKNPGLTPAERNSKWLELEQIYRPYMDSEGVTGYADGRRWQLQMHIYEVPFYYIDYCLAQSVALQFLLLSQKDYTKAFDKYFKLLCLAGTKSFVDLIGNAKLKNPFMSGSLSAIAKQSYKLLKTLKN